MQSRYRHFTQFPLHAPRPHLRLSPGRRFVSPSRSVSSQPAAGLTCRGEKGTQYRLAQPLGLQRRDKTPNVWLAVDASNPGAEYVVKRPGTSCNALSAFKHELQMQRLFAKEPMIRGLVDYVSDSEPGGPMMVLDAFTDSLWEARNVRAFTTREIKWVMKGVLLGIFTVHMKGLVYADLKMENVVLDGFEHSRPNEDVSSIITRLADCGAVTKPSDGEITSLTYRSPEVYFGKPWGQSTDVWSWGIILTQLFQAQVDFKSPGIYDSVSNGGRLEEKTKAVRDRIAIDFNLASVPFYSEDEQSAKLLPEPQPEEAYLWANNLVENGVAGEDVQFLAEVLHPDPDARLDVREILESGYLDG